MTKKEAPPPATFTPPASPEAEQSVLGAVLVRPEALDVVAEILDEGDFYKQAHAHIFHAMLDLHEAGIPVDLVTVEGYLSDRDQLEAVGGQIFLSGLSEAVGFATNAQYYAERV